MENKKENVLFSKEQIAERITEVAKVISEDYAGKKLYVLSLLRGS
ncbi:MAG: hypoxanthine phosphoribosyltransferase, partial [Clostridium sp.]